MPNNRLASLGLAPLWEILDPPLDLDLNPIRSDRSDTVCGLYIFAVSLILLQGPW